MSNRNRHLARDAARGQPDRGSPLLIVYRYRIAFPNARAHSIQIIKTCHALARAGAEVWLYPRNYTRSDPEEALACYGLEPHQNLHLRLKPGQKRWRGAMCSAWEELNFGALQRRRVVFFLRDSQESFQYALRIAHKRRRWGAKLLMETHRAHALELADVNERRTRDPSLQIPVSLPEAAGLEAAALRSCDGLLPISRSLATSLESLYEGLPRHKVLPSATDLDPAPDRPLSKREGILYVGQLYAWKGVEYLLQAMAHLPGERLTVVGGNAAADVEAAREIARKQGVEDQVQFVGQVGHDEVRAWIRRARCAVVPLGLELLARSFTSPLKIFEYMAGGAPIVASDLSTVREVLRDGENALLAAPADPKALAGAIRRVLHDDALAEQIRKVSLAEAHRYSWDARAESIIDFAESLTAEG